MPTYKELILQAFQDMDLVMLELLLEDSRTYQEATKQVFLKKIEEAFASLKKRGDKRLSIHKGCCGSNRCISSGHKGYTFLGDKSKLSLDLIFEEENGDILDIFHCSSFSPDNKDLERNNSLFFRIAPDERFDFQPNLQYSLFIQKYRSAYEEIAKHQNEILGPEIYCVWLNKYAELHQATRPGWVINYADVDRFNDLYNQLQELRNYLDQTEPAAQAIQEFPNSPDERSLLKWLVQYEELGRESMLFLYEADGSEGTESYYDIYDFKINTFDFQVYDEFWSLFHEYYWPMMEKYNTFTNEERIKFINEGGEKSDAVHSLTYHLRQRGLAF